MAAALASSRWGDLIDVTSAGVAPHGNSPTADAIAVVRDRGGVDISGHRPRGLEFLTSVASLNRILMCCSPTHLTTPLVIGQLSNT